MSKYEFGDIKVNRNHFIEKTLFSSLILGTGLFNLYSGDYILAGFSLLVFSLPFWEDILTYCEKRLGIDRDDSCDNLNLATDEQQKDTTPEQDITPEEDTTQEDSESEDKPEEDTMPENTPKDDTIQEEDTTQEDNVQDQMIEQMEIVDVKQEKQGGLYALFTDKFMNTFWHQKKSKIPNKLQKKMLNIKNCGTDDYVKILVQLNDIFQGQQYQDCKNEIQQITFDMKLQIMNRDINEIVVPKMDDNLNSQSIINQNQVIIPVYIFEDTWVNNDGAIDYIDWTYPEINEFVQM